METLLQELTLLATVRAVFLAIVISRILSFLARLLIVFLRGMIQDLRRFADDFLHWRGLTRGWIGLSLSLSSFVAYLVVAYLSERTPDTALAMAFGLRPVSSTAVFLGLVALVLYTAYRSWDQIRDTIEICDNLEKFRIYHKYKDGVEKLKEQPWMEESAGGKAASVALSALTWATDSVVKAGVAREAREVILGFAVLLAAESALRIALVVLAVYAASGALRPYSPF